MVGELEASVPVTLQGPHGTLSVHPKGGGLVQWHPTGQEHPVLYYSEDDLLELAMGQILSPFPNRLRNGEYPDGDMTRRLAGAISFQGHALHAFVRELPWSVEKGRDGRSLVSRCDWGEGELSHLGYPFGLHYEMAYEMDHGQLLISSIIRNVGNRAAPVALAFHPYFALSGGVDRACLHLPASSLRPFVRSPFRIGAPVDPEGSGFGFRDEASIGPRRLVGCYGDLDRDVDGWARTVITDEGWRRKITLAQDRTYSFIQLFTLDIPGPHHRKALAVEPSTSTPFPFDPHGSGISTLGPGEIMNGSWSIAVEGI